MNTNYNNKKGRPVTKGTMSEVVKPKRRLYSRRTSSNKLADVIEMKMDLVKTLVDMGIVLSNTHSIASKLISMGWIKTQKIEKDT